MSRAEITEKISNILDTHCKDCEKRDWQNHRTNIDICPSCSHGMALLALGKSLDEETKREREGKPLEIIGLTPDLYLELKDKGIGDHEIAKMFATNHKYLSDWKKTNGLYYVKRKLKYSSLDDEIDLQEVLSTEQIVNIMKEIKSLREKNKHLKRRVKELQTKLSKKVTENETNCAAL